MDVRNLKHNGENLVEKLRQVFTKDFPGVTVSDLGHWGSGRNQNQYYIQFTTESFPSGVHIEYLIDDGDGAFELHLEPKDSTQRRSLRKIGIALFHRLSDIDIVGADRSGLPFGHFWLEDWRIRDFDELIHKYRLFSNKILPVLNDLIASNREITMEGVYNLTRPSLNNIIKLNADKEDVWAGIMSLEDIMGLNLELPDYQRDYCWEDKNIIDLWTNLSKIEDGEPYHLGTIILHDYNGCYNIIDGQQRLITLTLMLYGLSYDEYLPLLNASYNSKEARDHISNCKYVVSSLIHQAKNTDCMAKTLAANVSFSVLIVNESSLDMAYTFFSNQNSKGVPLTDFDLLKAHHLRFISDDRQAEHIAINWNKNSQLPPVYHEDNSLVRAIGTHIYRLRKWMRKNHSQETKYRHIQQEYQAAPSMPDIPAFGEQFHFYEKIQGGTHFFYFVDTFVKKYDEFRETKVVKKLHEHLSWGPYEIFSDSIETLLFGYFLKFGNQYMAEAFYCISQMMALHRYNSSRVATDGSSVREFARSSELLLMIDQASSPTFFLAESIQQCEERYQKMCQEAMDCGQEEEPVQSGLYLPDTKGVKWGIYNSLKHFWHEMQSEISDSTIKKSIIEEYGK